MSEPEKELVPARTALRLTPVEAVVAATKKTVETLETKGSLALANSQKPEK
ncbi:MAG TPA: hypothetical protein PK644_00245 [bacterium]|nr:hypothetical protein [bacterium]